MKKSTFLGYPSKASYARGLFLGLLTLLSACSQAPERKLPNQNQPQAFLKINLSDDPETLDPRVVRRLKDLTVVKQLFEGLMRLDESGKPSLALAEDIEISEDLKTYIFHLRESSWSNSEPVTAHDFVYAWSKALDPSFRTDYSHMLYPIKNAKLIREGKCPVDALGVLAVDDRTIVIQLEEPLPFFLELTAFPTYFPVNRNVDIRHPDWSVKERYFVSNGPFIIESWKSRDELRLVKNPSYWDKNAVKLDGIILTMITDSNTESELYETNQLDWLGQPMSNNISAEMMANLKKEEKLNSYPVAGTSWFTFNTSQAPFDDIRIRKAFAYSIPRKEIIEHILQGFQRPATSPIPFFMSGVKQPFFNDGDCNLAVALFEEYLNEKKLDRETFSEVVLLSPPLERNSKIAQAIQQHWQKTFQIPIKLEVAEGKLLREKIRLGQFQIASGQWVADYNDPIAFLEIFKFRNEKETGLGLNDSQWQNQDYIRLLDQSKMEQNPEKRLAILQAAEKILVDEMPIAPLYHYTFDYIKKDYVKNVILSPLGIADFKHAEICQNTAS